MAGIIYCQKIEKSNQLRKKIRRKACANKIFVVLLQREIYAITKGV